MEKIIHKYETIFIVDCTLSEENLRAVIEKFTNLISENGTLESVDEWGKKRLAYEINDQKEGFYVLVNFASSAEFIAELERIYRITDGVMRSLVIKKEEK